MADTEIGGLIVRMKADLSDYQAKLTQMEKQTTTTSEKVQTSFKSISDTVAKAGVVLSGFAATAVNSAVKWGTAVAGLSAKTGMAAEESSKLLAVAKRVGIGTDEASQMFSRFARSAYNAAEGQAAAAQSGASVSDVYSKLGISLLNTNGSMKSTAQIFSEVQEKIAAMPNGLEKTALEMEMFGRSGAQMHGILNMTKGEMDAVTEKARAMGLILNDAQASGMKNFGRDVNEAKGMLTTMGIAIGTELMPQLRQLMTEVQGGVKWFMSLDQETKSNIISTVKLAAEMGIAAAVITRVTGALGGAAEALGLMRAATIAAIGPWLALAAAITLAMSAMANQTGSQMRTQIAAGDYSGVDDMTRNAMQSQVEGDGRRQGMGDFNKRDDEAQVNRQAPSIPEMPEMPEMPSFGGGTGGSSGGSSGGGSGGGGGAGQSALEAYIEKMNEALGLEEKRLQLGVTTKEAYDQMLGTWYDGLSKVETGEDEAGKKQSAMLDLESKHAQVLKDYYQETGKAMEANAEEERRLREKEINEHLEDESEKYGFELQYNEAKLADKKKMYALLLSEHEEYEGKKDNLSGEEADREAAREALRVKKIKDLYRDITLEAINAAQKNKEAWAHNLSAIISGTSNAHDILERMWEEFIEKLLLKMNIFGSVESNIFTGLLGGLFGMGGGGGSPSEGFSWPTFATGGYVSGPGTATSDSIPIWASNGEGVLNAEAVKMIGVGGLNALNSGKWPKFADGGIVGNYVSPSDLYQQAGQSTSVVVNQNFNGQQDASVVDQIKASIPYIKSEIRNAMRNETSMRTAVRGAAK